MGTITNGIEKTKLFSDIEHDLKKVLGNNSNPKFSNKEKYDLKLTKAHSYMIKDGYRNHTYGYIKRDKFIFLASNPEPFFYKLHDYKITIHLSQWKNLEEVVDAFCDIFGAKNTQAIFTEGQVLRLDAWLDTDLSYELLKKTIFRNGVSVSDQRKGDRKTFYLGSKKPSPALFYEKYNIPQVDLDLSKNGSK